MTKKQRNEYKAANQRRKAHILKRGMHIALCGVIQDGKHTNR